MTESSAAFSSDGSEILNRKTEIQLDTKPKRLTDDELRWALDINETVRWIVQGSFERVALQFPDSLLSYSAKTAEILERESGAKLYILADTTYGSCCVDEIAAQHCRADCIVHYGEACLSQPATKLPVKFVFPKSNLDLEDFRKKISSRHFTVVPELLILYELGINYCADSVKAVVNELFPNLTVFDATPVMDPCTSKSDDIILGREVAWPSNLDKSKISVIFIGKMTSPLLVLWRLRFPEMTSFLIYDIEKREIVDDSKNNVSRIFMKRLFLVEKVKDAQIIGIVTGTLGVHGHLETLSRIKKLCSDAGKKTYTFSIGKLNVPKISNFAIEIDVFVMISCPFGVLLDFSDYYKPIVSPFELEVALNPADKEGGWMAEGWSAEIKDCLKNPLRKCSTKIDEDDDCPDISLVTGKLRLMNPQHAPDAEKQMQVYSAGNYFGNRSWKGLDAEIASEIPVKLAEEGRSGIASEYDNEPQKYS